MEKTISRKMAEFAAGLHYEDLSKAVVDEIKKYLYDSLGCAFAGSKTKDVGMLRDIYENIGGKPESRLFVSGKQLPALSACVLNSLMIRSLDFNDIYWKEDPSHPSDIIPAAICAGELVGASMKEVIVGIALAYEFEQRLCEFGKPGVRERKWHHATLTQFVSPLVAARVLNLTEDQIVNAIGISGCHNHTIGCPTAGKLTMMKNTVDPMAVQSGLLAALMAQKGYSGTEAVFEGKEGLMDVFGPNWDVDALFTNLGTKFKVLECSMKAFPTEALTHTHITCVLKVVKGHSISYKDIESVSITTIARACDILFDPHKYRPTSRETADHSLPYCIAVALVDHQVTTESFRDEKMKDPAIWEVIDKIKGEASQEFEKMFPAKQPSRVVVKLKDGITFSEYLEYPKGDPREPMTEEDLDAKFNALTAGTLTEAQQKFVKQTVMECENYSVDEFMEKITLIK